MTGTDALWFLTTAQARGRDPSDLMGIGCNFCAHAFAEALVIRARAHESMEMKRQKHDAELEANEERARADVRREMGMH